MFHVKRLQGVSSIAITNTIAKVATGYLHTDITEHENVGLWQSQRLNMYQYVGFTNRE